MITLAAAVRALDDRKTAVLGQGPKVSEVDGYSNEARMMVLGFDLDLEEMHLHAAVVGRYAANHEQELSHAAGAAWLDGLLSGLMLAELRAAEEA